jgi:hypothetical protein
VRFNPKQPNFALVPSRGALMKSVRAAGKSASFVHGHHKMFNFKAESVETMKKWVQVHTTSRGAPEPERARPPRRPPVHPILSPAASRAAAASSALLHHLPSAAQSVKDHAVELGTQQSMSGGTPKFAQRAAASVHAGRKPDEPAFLGKESHV